MSGSRWVITPLWLSGSWRSFLYNSSVYSCHLFLIYVGVHSFRLLFDHFQFVLFHGHNIPDSYAILLFTPLDFTSITSHIHNWVLFVLWFRLFILPGVNSPLISSSMLGTYRPGEFIFQCSIFLPFHTVHGVLKARMLKWFAIPFSSIRFIEKLEKNREFPYIYSSTNSPLYTQFPLLSISCITVVHLLLPWTYIDLSSSSKVHIYIRDHSLYGTFYGFSQIHNVTYPPLTVTYRIVLLP